MAIFKCNVCGYLYDEAGNTLFSALPDDWRCPICGAEKAKFTKVKEASEKPKTEDIPKDNPLAYPKEFAKYDSQDEPYMDMIHQMSLTGESIISPMGTHLSTVSWNDILILGAQLNPSPLDAHADVTLTTVIGKHARQPMELDGPVYISHMSFGALSKEIKVGLAKGSAMAGTAMCSGEGGILPEEKAASYKYIFEYVPNLYSVTDENLKEADAIEIKIGQGTKPGMGGHLPGAKVTPEIAKIRNKPVGEDVISPSRFPNIQTKEDVKAMVDWLREVSEGRPIGIKIAAGHIEKDLEWIAYAKPDFITIDGRGGATGSSPKFLKDSTSVPTVYALYRAKKFLRDHNLDIDLVITGGLRTSGDFAKAIAMGADAVAIASAALIALGCQRYRVCHKGTCPMGIATQDPELRARLLVEKGAQRVVNFLNVAAEELRAFARCTGHGNIHELSMDDIETTSSELSGHTDIRHV